MIGLIQRVSEASVRVDEREIAHIGRGLLVLVAVQQGDGEHQARRLAERLLGFRVFPDTEGRMNLSLTQVEGGLLLVPQFTLAADTARGNRPGFSRAASPEAGRRGFDQLVAAAQARWAQVRTGQFGADMSVSLVNDGPVTFWLEALPD